MVSPSTNLSVGGKTINELAIKKSVWVAMVILPMGLLCKTFGGKILQIDRVVEFGSYRLETLRE